MKRRLPALAAAVVLVSISVLGGASAPVASAAPVPMFDCAHFGICPPGYKPPAPPGTPTPHVPGDGLSGLFDPTPAPGSSDYARYGYSPLHWDLYAEPSLLSHPTELGAVSAASIDNMIGGWLFGAAVDISALANGLGRLISPPTFLGSLDKLVKQGTDAMDRAIWTPFLAIALMIVGLGIIVTGIRRQDTAAAMHSAIWAVGVLGLVGYVVLFSTTLGGSADKLVSSTIDGIYAAVDGQQNGTPAAAGALEERLVLVPLWERGELGSSTSQVAVTYGPKLLDANGYTWAQVGGNGSKNPTSAVTKAKSAEWTAAAQAIQKASPAAYAHMTDANPGRISSGVVALIAAVLTTSFRLVADLLVLAALLMIRLAIIVLPAVGVISINVRMDGLLRSLISKVGSALISCVAFSAGAAVNVLAVGVLLSPTVGLPLFFGVILCGIVTVALWVVLKPFRKLTSLVGVGTSHVSGMRSQRRKDERHEAGIAAAVAKAAGTAAVGAVSGGVGAVAAEHVMERRERDEARPAEPRDDIPVEREEMPVEREEAQPAPEVDDNPLAPHRDVPADPEPDEELERVAEVA